MTSKTFCSDGRIFRKTVVRFWPLWAGYLLLWLLIFPTRVYSELTTAVRFERDVQTALLSVIRGEVHPFTAFLSFLIAPLSAMSVFSHLYASGACGLFSSLPIRRGRMFAELTAAGFAAPAMCSLLTALAVGGVEASFGVFHLASLAEWFAFSLMYLAAFYGLAVFCAQLTGAMVVGPVVYVIFLLLPLISLAVEGFCSFFLYGFSFRGSTANWYLLSPLLSLLSANSRPVYDAAGNFLYFLHTDWCRAGIYAGCGVLLTAGAALLYRHRRMETAGDWVAVRPLRAVFRWCMAIGCALLLSVFGELFLGFEPENGIFGLTPFLSLLFFSLIGSLIGWFGADMLMKKTFRVFSAHWKGWLVCFALLLALLCSLRFDLFGYETHVPHPDAVQSVSLDCRGNGMTYTDPDNIDRVLKLHERIVRGKNANYDEVKGSYYLHLTYELHGGGVLQRDYRLYTVAENEDLLRYCEGLFNSEDALRQRWDYRNSEDYKPQMFREGEIVWLEDGAGEERKLLLSPAETADLYLNCIRPDMLTSSLNAMPFFDESAYSRRLSNVTFCVDVCDEDAPQYYTDDPYVEKDSVRARLWVHLTIDAERTCNWLKAHGVPVVPMPEG